MGDFHCLCLISMYYFCNHRNPKLNFLKCRFYDVSALFNVFFFFSLSVLVKMSTVFCFFFFKFSPVATVCWKAQY